MAELAPNDRRHGTTNGYYNLRCRCELCKAAARAYYTTEEAREYQRQWSWRTGRSKPLAERLADIEPDHGTESRYNSPRWRCRCCLCMKASATARRLRRQRSG